MKNISICRNCGSVVNTETNYKQGFIDAFELITDHFEKCRNYGAVEEIDKLYDKAVQEN